MFFFFFSVTDHYVYNDVIAELEKKGYALKKQVANILQKHGLRLSPKPQVSSHNQLTIPSSL